MASSRRQPGYDNHAVLRLAAVCWYSAGLIISIVAWHQIAFLAVPEHIVFALGEVPRNAACLLFWVSRLPWAYHNLNRWRVEVPYRTATLSLMRQRISMSINPQATHEAG
jgi:hypothetical protein